jgi:small subunit ribosomal protein S18
VSGNNAQQQAEIARAIKNAREMALLPYASRVTQTRGPKRDGDRRGRERDRDLPAPETEPLASIDVLEEEGFESAEVEVDAPELEVADEATGGAEEAS